MHRKYAEWLWANVIFASFPVLIDMVFHAWRGPIGWGILTTPDNIPAFAFAVGMLSMSASSDVGEAVIKLKRDEEQAKFTHFKNLLIAGAVVTMIIFGAYEGLHVWLPGELDHGGHALSWAAIVSSVFFGICGCFCERSALTVLARG